MPDPFEGTWSKLVCTGPPDIQNLLEGAILTIANDTVTWAFKGMPAPASTTLDDNKLWGELIFESKSYYYEIAARTPPQSLTAPKRYLYGIVSQNHRDRSGGDLGDPGTWKAEESGKDPAG